MVESKTTVRVSVPPVLEGADVQRSWRRVLTGVDDRAEGDAAVVGPEVGHGAVVETAAGALVLVVDQHVTGWGETYYGGKKYPLMDAAVSLHLVQGDGALKPLWARHFKRAKGAFGAAGLGQLRKHLTAHPAAGDLPLTVVDPGPGRPNFRPGPCRWCAAVLPKGQGVLVGRGEAAQVEHRQECPSQPAEPGTYCARCGVSVAPGAARVVVVREGEGRREIQHTGRCEDHKSYFVWEQEQAQRRADEDARRAEEKAAEEKRARRREAAAEKRRVAREAKERAAKQAAEVTRARVESLAVVEETGRTELYDKGLDPYGERMRLVEVAAVLADGEPATWWEVAAYGGQLEDDVDDRGGRYFLLPDARDEYRRYEYQPEQYRPRRRPRVGAVPCPADGAKHCDNCGTTVAPGGWMTASLGLACDVDCYDAMADARGAHAVRYHR
ncbi:hypothetical protein KVH27_35520 [Streptomyces olivaceus]|uniref:hypothetical protein n=1 Tax=Streptomyces olivaceus TaxID=47716 RepID=UPI001CC98667|nr:hypothetical protein [Streptomyces olivaceus]MBZ6253661.1 hypothetical protein [Streptomyces olivaceus]